MDLIEKAKTIAEQAHEGQVRKSDGTPYIVHPLAVAGLVKEYGFSDTAIAAALVHDVLEDTDVTETELRHELNDAVVDIVVAVSENKDLEWEERKLQYIKAVSSAGEEAKAVSVADKVHNALSLIDAHGQQGPEVWNKFRRGREKSLWFQRTLYEELDKEWQHPLLDRYSELVVEMEKLA